MEMRGVEDIDIGQDLTPPVPPLAFSLLDSTLLSHCSSCFSPLPPSPSHSFTTTTPLYCSTLCHHISSSSHHPHLPTSDLRLSLRLLHHFESKKIPLPSPGENLSLSRIDGLLTNREKLEEDDGVLEGAREMRIARAMMRDDVVFDREEEWGGCEVEEGVLGVVLTNAVEVQDKEGRSVGVAVYGREFSWINHSCCPNACYRFLIGPELDGGGDRMRISPAGVDCGSAGGGGSELEDSCAGNSKFEVENEECEMYGPRIVVRSIKPIKKGEEVTIAYTDLLQPKIMRQSELRFKYRFICCCTRCSTLPPTYVDHVLQEISAVDLDLTNLSTDHNFYREEATKKFTDYVDDTISNYLSFSNPESCCEKLENMLTHGLLVEQLDRNKGTSQQKFKLHPLHHFSLNAYTTLASAYKMRGTDILALNPETKESRLGAFIMSRTSAAYSLLLAGATHNLFLLESSLITSVANFWMSAGESLLNLSRSPMWNLFSENGKTTAEPPYTSSYNCCTCGLLDKLEASSYSSRDRNSDFEGISREFLNCITNIIPKIWSFLVYGNCYLVVIKDPINFRWLGTGKSFERFDSDAHLGCFELEREVSKCDALGYTYQKQINLFRLGLHCLKYGGFLSSICYGKHTTLT